MKINLKQLSFQINTLDMIISDITKIFGQNSRNAYGVTPNDLKALLALAMNIQEQLKEEGKATIHLDMRHEEAIKAAYYGD